MAPCKTRWSGKCGSSAQLPSEHFVSRRRWYLLLGFHRGSGNPHPSSDGPTTGGIVTTNSIKRSVIASSELEQPVEKLANSAHGTVSCKLNLHTIEDGHIHPRPAA